jgi:glutamyl-tRNA(Gln) amidotransferase subunit D
MKVGEYVRMNLAKRQIEGVLLESYDSDVYLIKLKSGYNIGIPKENVYGSEVLKKVSEESKKFEIPKHKKGLKNIGLVVTGGTIASKLDAKTGGVTPLTDVGEFSKFYPELFERVNVLKVDVPFMKASENMDSDDWRAIAESVGKMLKDEKIDGIVVTHGTDFLHYTSAALSFMLGKVNKPVVLTYSQRSIDRGSSDARLNLECSAHFAVSNCAEVVLVGHASTNDDFCFALRGTKVRKMHTSRRDAFKPVNVLPIAKVWPTKIEFISDYRIRSGKFSEGDFSFSDKIALVKFYPGQSVEVLEWYKQKGFYGVVVEAAGLGHLATSGAKYSWISSLKKLTKDGFVVCAAAQTLYGRLHPKVYSAGRELEKAGVIFLGDMLPETAFVKLGWVLGHRHWRSAEKVREKMLENFVGEFNERLSE